MVAPRRPSVRNGPTMILRTLLDWIDSVIVLLMTAMLRVAGGYALSAGAVLVLLIGAWVAVRRITQSRAAPKP
jgi:hypothetical protein